MSQLQEDSKRRKTKTNMWEKGLLGIWTRGNMTGLVLVEDLVSCLFRPPCPPPHTHLLSLVLQQHPLASCRVHLKRSPLYSSAAPSQPQPLTSSHNSILVSLVSLILLPFHPGSLPIPSLSTGNRSKLLSCDLQLCLLPLNHAKLAPS